MTESKFTKTFAVCLGAARVGKIIQVGDYTRFQFLESYYQDPERRVLGLAFEDNLEGTFSSALRLIPWFSNLLPEGILREWVASDRGVSADREMELLAQLGHDLPGAVRVLPVEADGEPAELPVESAEGANSPLEDPGWKFSLAGVVLKFSVVAVGDRLTLPASGEGGDWIVKMPHTVYPGVPGNEAMTMSLASVCGIDVPEHRLVHRDLLELPEKAWVGKDEFAYAIRRFDRGPERELIHIEDFAQVLSRYPGDKYMGNYESIANLIYRGTHTASLLEFVRRLVFCVCVQNGDAHLKNWSLIYADGRVPELSPAYDLVATHVYRGSEDGRETSALKLNGSRRFESVGLKSFARLEQRLGADGAGLVEAAEQTVSLLEDHWESVVADSLLSEAHRSAFSEVISAGLRQFRGQE